MWGDRDRGYIIIIAYNIKKNNAKYLQLNGKKL